MTGKEDFEVLTHEQAYPLHDAEFKRVNSRLKMIEDTLDTVKTDVNERLLNVEFKVDDYGKRLEKEERQTEAMLEIAHSVKDMSKTLEKVVTEQDSQRELLTHIVNKPGQIAIKSWIFVLTMVATSLVSAIIGLVAGAAK